MTNYVNTSLFQIYPYIALAVFAIGCWARFDHGAYTWRSGSSQLLSGKWMRLGSNWFHIGILAILAIPTVVFSLYGMNFEWMPELHWKAGYPMVVAATALACFLVYRRLRRAAWV